MVVGVVGLLALALLVIMSLLVSAKVNNDSGQGLRSGDHQQPLLL